MIKNCLNPKCDKEFTPKNNKGVYCSGNCRAAHAYQLSKEPKPEAEISHREKYLQSCEIVNGIRCVDMEKLRAALEADGFKNALEPINTLQANEKAKEIFDYAKGSDKKETPVSPINPNEKRISELRNELKNPPKNPQIGLRKWIAVRENEIKSLETQTTNH